MRARKGKKRGRHAHYSGPEGATVEELAAQLAPPEEQEARALGGGGAPQHAAGAIVVDTAALKMPTGFSETRQASRFEIARVVVFVAALMLLFTAFIAWQIAQTPDDRDEPQPVRVVPGEQ